MRHPLPSLTLSLLLVAACRDATLPPPATAAPLAGVGSRLVETTTGFYFLPPLVDNGVVYSGVFDGTREPTVRVVCTGATGPWCPTLASFGGPEEQGISVDLEGQSYAVVWQSPPSLELGQDRYRLQVFDGDVQLGAADLVVADSRQALKGISGGVGVVRGSPLVIKFRIETTAEQPPPVASVEVTPATSSVLAGATVQLTAVTEDANGQVLAGRSVSWSSSDESIATVSSAGLVTTIAPGTVTITAQSEGQSGTASVESVDPTAIAAFDRPFSVAFEVRTTNYHDHDTPREFVDANGIYLPYWGEPSFLGIDGHEGYDWQLPIGTPITAVAAGTVIDATLAGPSFFCPLINAPTSNSRVILQHALPGGVIVRSLYVHVDQINVAIGQTVAAGQVIATSGNRGCSSNPHLHFAVNRVTQTNDGTPSPIDPYGWEGAGVDPWTQHAEGAASIRLWKAGEAPDLFRSVILPFSATPSLLVQMTKVRYQGVRDALNPNNEYIEVSRDLRFTAAPAELDIGGFTIAMQSGATYTFPAGTILSTSQPTVRLYVGAGTPVPGTLFWGQSSGVMNNLVECVRLFNASTQLRNSAGWGGGCLQ
jgi:murein DD-endopeptidase MepM/ murein hydrolase activator NlpD